MSTPLFIAGAFSVHRQRTAYAVYKGGELAETPEPGTSRANLLRAKYRALKLAKSDLLLEIGNEIADSIASGEIKLNEY